MQIKKIVLLLHSLKKNSSLYTWSVRLSARTPGFHPGKRGSIPLRTTEADKAREVFSFRA